MQHQVDVTVSMTASNLKVKTKYNIKRQSDPNTYRYMMVNFYIYIQLLRAGTCNFNYRVIIQLKVNQKRAVLILALLNFS